MKKTYFTIAFIFFVITITNAQFIDDMESYTDGQPINNSHWTNWGCGGGAGCDLMSSSAEAQEGNLSGLISNDGTTDAVLNLGNKIFGEWGLSFWMYIPSEKEAYWNLQGTVPIGAGEWIVGNFFFNQDNANPGIGYIDNTVMGVVSFSFPHDQWFRVVMNCDITTGISNATWQLDIDGANVIPVGTDFADSTGNIPQSLGGIDFFSISIDNILYLDNFNYENNFIDPEDNEDPIAVCQNITVDLDEFGNASITGNDIDGGSSDNIEIISFIATPNTFNCNDTGDITVTLTVEDASGNSATCDAIVTVEDNISPIVMGQNATGNLNGNGTVTIPLINVDTGSSDNCNFNLTLTPDTYTTIGVYNAVLEGIDASGNSNSITVEITIIDVLDNEDPIAVCQNIDVSLDIDGNATISGSDIDGGSTDNVEIAFLSAFPNIFNCSNLGANSVVLTVEDVSGLTSTCTATVTIIDNIAPTVIGQDLTKDLLNDTSITILPAEVDNGSFDNCSIENLTLTPDTFSAIGDYNAVLEGTDSSGNTNSTSVTITIIDSIDNEDPIAVCQNITVQLDSNGNAFITGTDIDGGSSDNIGITALIATPNNFNCSNIGANSVTLTVEDANGNINTCNATVTIEDTINPTIIGQNAIGDLFGAGTITVPVADVNNNSFDNCNIDNLTLTPDTFTAIGDYDAVLEGTDSSGNSNNVTVTITIIDTFLGVNDTELNNFILYPNPAKNNITIKVDATTLLEKIEVFDIRGSLIINKNIEGSTQSYDLNISDLANNIYFISITDTDGNKGIKKLIKE